ncbi:uncharacterized protein LOC143179627 [Calliopsis andreniformis]|uniref:uncharacterized protein LOC143179627 n=1 Tax=Calliopsis andreniformis TaxID=337506 RepID=UPI003FCE3998
MDANLETITNFRSGETLAFITKGYSEKDNVGGLHELQGCELRRHHAAIGLDFRRRDRKWVLRVWKLLHNHETSASTGESVVRIWQGDRELASAGESRQTLTSILLTLLSFALSTPAVKHENLKEKSSTIPSSSHKQNNSMHYKRLSSKNRTNSGPEETLFIPEDPDRYSGVLSYVQRLLERGEQSTDGFNHELSENVDPSGNDTRETLDSGEDKFLELQNPPEAERNSRLPENAVKYLARNPGRVSSGTTVGNNRGTDTVWVEDDENLSEEGRTEPEEEDLVEAANFGLEAMRNLYLVKEPTLYSMGLYLNSDNPARHVATFNDQTEEARALAKYGFAVLQSTSMFKKKFPDAVPNSHLSRRGQSNPLRRHCPNRGIPDCPPASLRYRTSDGSCNNLKNLWWGSAMSPMQRFLQPVYDDGVQTIRRSVTRAPLPSARLVTSVIHEDRDIPLASVTHMLMQWGQFVDHDVTATGQSRGFNGTIPQCCLNFGTGFQPPEFMHPECLPIAVSAQDSFFGPLGVKCLEFLRSGPAPRENCEFGPREQLTQVTSYLDASTVYSSNAFQTDTLRLFRNGLLQYGKLQSQRPLLPKQNFDLCKRGSLSTSCFRAGDGRLGEQPALTSLHVVFLRLHNRIATKLAALNPHWSDEKLFQESRRIVGAVVQHITYREFLPIVLGQNVMKIFDLEVFRKDYYEGYDPTVNPTIANEFSTAAYRFGHSLVQRSFIRFDSSHLPIFNNVSIHKEFSNPANLETEGSVDRLLLGLINQPSQKRDEHITEELTNHLFQTPSFPFGMDLASINIQRGRDHGIPPYVRWREPCGLSPIKTFEDLERVMPPSAARKFKLVYSSVEDIDLFTAGLAEKSVSSGLVGPTFACIIGQQFSNLRRGDRFWYENSGQENSFTPGQLQQIRRASLAQVLCSTMDQIETIQPFVFLTQDTLRNQRLPCNDPTIGQLDLGFWTERSSQFKSRGGFLDILKRKNTTQQTTSKPTTQKQSGPTASEKLKIFPHSGKPVPTSINQQNRIVIKRPLRPSDNVTVVVHNNAVNSPVFVSDSIYGSNIRIDPSSQPQSQEISPPRPIPGPVNRPLQHIPVFIPTKPIPTSPPPLSDLLASHPYIPYAFSDPNNPNPLSQGFQSIYETNDVLFESFPATSPRPTLYTYYTNFQRPATQRPLYDVDPYGSKYRPSSGQSLEAQYPKGGQLPSKPHFDSLGSSYSGNRYEIDNWQRLHQDLVSQLKDSGYWNNQRYRPSNPYPKDPSNWGSQNDRYRPGDSLLTDIRPPAMAPYQAEAVDETNDRYHSGKPVYQYQPSRRPVQANPDGWSNIPTHQKESDRADTKQVPNYHVSRPSTNTLHKESTVSPDSLYIEKFSDRPILGEGFTATSHETRLNVQSISTDKSATNDFKRNQSLEATSESYQVQLDKSPSSYQSPTRPKPTKVYSVTIVTEEPEAVNQGGSKVNGLENSVTSEVPKPLSSQVINNVRRPGQYYYEKNVLRRYPDKIEDQTSTQKYQSVTVDAEQRHKIGADRNSIDGSIIEGNAGVVDGNESNTNIEETASQQKNDSRDGVRDDDVDPNLDQAFLEDGEGVTSTNRTSNWLNPEEDTTLPSAPEQPEMPTDKAAAANELPKPIKCRRHGS